MFLKKLLRHFLNEMHLDLTQNLKYDRLTKLIISRVVKPDSICVDVGCHKGEILDLFIEKAPIGGHFAFEPIPVLYYSLLKMYSKRNHVFQYALSDKEGFTSFQFVKNAPAYSGILKRSYEQVNPDIEEINVEMKMLDSVIPGNIKIDLIKIDVEGGELGVLKGAKQIIKKDKPVIIFECGIGASDYYGTQPEDVYQFLVNENGLNIYLLDAWLKKEKALTEQEFVNVYKNKVEYYFVAN